MSLGPGLRRRVIRSCYSAGAKPPSGSSSIMSHQQPSWLKSLLSDQGPPPKLFAWTPANIESTGKPQTQTGQVALPGAAEDLDRRIFILGVGNIGRLFASYLARHPQPPPITLVVHRKELLSTWVHGEGIELTRDGLATKNKDFNVEWWTDTAPEHGRVQEVANGHKLRNLLIATKASAAMPEADRLRGYLDSNSTIVFAQNGMSKLWPPHGPTYLTSRYLSGSAPNVLACVVNHGVLSAGPFKSVHTAPADACVGPVLLSTQPPPSVEYLTAKIASTPLLNFKAVSSGELWLLQLEKLVMNAVINPLTALLRCKNGDLFTSEDQNDPLTPALDKILSQTSTVLRALINHDDSAGILASYARSSQQHMSDDGHHKETIDSHRMELAERFSQSRLKSKLCTFGRKVGENRSSMLQDIEAGRQTEVRDFNGWIMDTATYLDDTLDISAHRALTEWVERGLIFDRQELAQRLLSV